MKIALLLSIACAALVFSGCSTERGGSSDTYDISHGTSEQTAPPMTDPSLPQDPNAGPQISPP
jgi:PBP1b-binding outer membrane lipoprotein LpoB